MTEPNIVYIGDEVRFDGDSATVIGYTPALGILAVDNSGDIGIQKATSEELTTPDGRPVDGFGGALITRVDIGELYDPPEIFWTISRAFDCDDLDIALHKATMLYGEWVREPTEADLKRRGLL